MSISTVTSSTVSLMPSGSRPVVVKTPVSSDTTPAYEAKDKLTPTVESRQATPTNPTVDNANPSPDELGKLLTDLQRKVPAASKELQFSVDQESGKSLVKLTDRATKEVLWQLPSEVALRISKELDQFQKGSLVNHKA